MKIKKGGAKISKDAFLYGSMIALVALIVFVSQVIQSPVTLTKNQASTPGIYSPISNCRLTCKDLTCIYKCLKDIFTKVPVETQILKSFKYENGPCNNGIPAFCEYNVTFECMNGYSGGTFRAPWTSDDSAAREMAGIICNSYSNNVPLPSPRTSITPTPKIVKTEVEPKPVDDSDMRPINLTPGVSSCKVDPNGWYLAKYPDVTANSTYRSPTGGLRHYCEYGKSEGRENCFSFNDCSNLNLCLKDPNGWYLTKYPDVKANSTYGSVTNGGLRHYCEHGKSEGRENCFDSDRCVKTVEEIHN